MTLPPRGVHRIDHRRVVTALVAASCRTRHRISSTGDLPSLPLWAHWPSWAAAPDSGSGFDYHRGAHARQHKPPPTQTLEGLKENIQWKTKK